MRRIKWYLFTSLLLLPACAVASPSIYAQAADSKQSPAGGGGTSCFQRADYPQSFLDRLAGPPGGWTVGYMMEQAASPVVIAGLSGFGGRRRGAEKGLAVVCALLKNNSGKAVSGVKLSWVLSAQADPRQTVLLRGDVTPFEVHLAEGEKKEADFEDIIFSEVSRPLMKGGALEGAYRWIFRVAEVRYEDGSVWEGPPPNNGMQRTRN